MGLDKIKDSNLIKMKDIVLLLLAMGSLFSVVVRVYSKPEQLENRIHILEQRTEERALKYIPKIEGLEIGQAVITEQYKSIMSELKDIKGRLRR